VAPIERLESTDIVSEYDRTSTVQLANEPLAKQLDRIVAC
jgi:hypothetical protein